MTLPPMWEIVGSLPPGLTLDATTGVISGAPIEVGTSAPVSLREQFYGRDFPWGLFAGDADLTIDVKRWLPGDPRPGPELPGGRFQNLDWEEE